eukprot:Ihof_evm2s389 gene=Ihof_evmTU2s389
MSFASQLSVQPGHGYVALSLVFSALTVHLYGGHLVHKARKLYNVTYPKLYADGDDEKAKMFNCVQRGHQNVLENLATHYMLTMVSCGYRPTIAAVACIVRTLGFCSYMKGYATGKPERRATGFY